VDTGIIHQIIPVANADALHCRRDLAQKEGISVGITAGAHRT
jgi:cysteine synthase